MPMDDEAMSEADVVALMGAERFTRLRAEGWLTPFYQLTGHEGRPRYVKHLVDFRHQEDLRLHPGSRPPPVVTKGYATGPGGGVPDVVVDRDGVHRVVVKAAPAAAGWAAQIRAEVVAVLAAGRRFLHARGVSW
jgi:hypothetical protein